VRQINIDDETFDGVIVGYLKDSLELIKTESSWMNHPDDRFTTAKMVPAFLTVLSYFMTSDEFEKYAFNLFSDKDEEDEEEGEDDEG
jgi:hypothetical protein